MADRKVHLLVKTPGTTACGLRINTLTDGARVAVSPRRVTCGGCCRTVHMADAEMRVESAPRSERRATTHHH